MPIDAAVQGLGYAPAIDTEEGLRRTIQWLRWAGYPVEGV
jgi:nucleoside-diphosphate-sugar epimerase